jgi:phage-related protein
LALSLINLTDSVLIPLTPVIVGLSSLLSATLSGALSVLIPVVQTVIGWFTKFTDAVTDTVTWIVDKFRWLFDVLVGHSIIPDLVKAIVAWFAGLPGKTVAALGNIASRVAGVFRDAADRMLSAVRTGITNAVNAIAGLPGKAVKALGDLSGTLAAAGRALIGGFISGIADRIGDVQSTLGGLTDKLTSWKGPPAKDAVILRPSGRLVLGGFIDGIADQVPALRASLGGITAGLPGMTIGGGSAALPGGGSLLTPGATLVAGAAAARATTQGPAPLRPAFEGGGITVNMTVNSMTLPTGVEKKRFASEMADAISDALRKRDRSLA